MKRAPFSRCAFSLSGALLGAAFIAFLEAVRASREWRAPVGPLFLGDAAVLVPLATAIGLAVASAGAFLDPELRWTLPAVSGSLRHVGSERRGRWATMVLLAPGASLAWVLACAHEARSALELDASTPAAGTLMSVVSIAALMFAGACVLAAAAVLAPDRKSVV